MQEGSRQGAGIKPLVLDVDGTFLRTDLLWECFWAGLGRAPLATMRACARHFGHRPALKEALAGVAGLRTDLMPVNAELADLALQSRVAGRAVVLASGADRSLVRQLAADYGLSERVFASDGQVNLTGARKAAALVAAYGEGGFDYAGNSAVDMAVWEHADQALVVGHVASARTLATRGQNVLELSPTFEPRALLRALRPHQWVKNILLLLAMIAAHRFDLATLLPIMWGILAFSAAASSIYLVNDLLDLEADRLHPTKKRRPFAAGTVPITLGMGTIAVLAMLALGISAALNLPFLGVVLVYMGLSLAYSLRLKR
ncbi:MAG: UbiA family prenyltransferase, partial [Rhodobacteraceae bacterium]|nr:UbiA family prenyltransferase [Paracoccaceae bacterium]